MAAKPKRQAYVDEWILNAWNEAAEDPQHLEIIRLAFLGLWAEKHAVAIEDALSAILVRLPVAQISRFEKALDGHPKRKNA